MSEGEIVHIEFSAQDSESAGKFYAKLFDWKISSWSDLNYTMFEPKAGPGGGFAQIDGSMYNRGDVLVYIQTDDLEGKLSLIENLGGKIVATRTPIDDKSWFALFEDPTGNRVGLYTTVKPV